MKQEKSLFYLDREKRTENSLENCLKKLSLFLNKENIILKKTELGKPFIVHENATVGSVSISHTEHIFVIAFSQYFLHIGLDIQNTIIDKKTIFSFLTEKEKRYKSLQSKDFELFGTKVWAMKEAFVKALGTGFEKHPQTICVEDMLKRKVNEAGSILYQDKKYSVKLLLLEEKNNYHLIFLAIC